MNFFYPIEISNIIIIRNPIMVTKGIIVPFSFALSGINSLITTYNIAPPAKANKNGRQYLILITSIAPNTADIGSTIPDNIPSRNDFVLE